MNNADSFKYVALARVFMLDLKIMKVCHGRDDAKKVSRYVANTDAFGLEMWKYEESALRSWEDLFFKEMKAGRSMPLFSMPTGGHSDETLLFLEDLREAIFKERKVIWCPERRGPEESGRVNELYRLYKEVQDQAMVYLVHGEVDRHVKHMSLFWAVADTFYALRDEAIVRNVASAEQQLRGRWPHLFEQEVIKYGLCIGASHVPETKLTNSDKLHFEVCDLVDLGEERKKRPIAYLAIETLKAHRQNVNIENLVLANAVCMLYGATRRPVPDPTDLLKREKDELITMVKKTY